MANMIQSAKDQVAQITRSALLETLQEDYIDTARADVLQ